MSIDKSTLTPLHQSLMKSSGIVSLGVLSSRALGFVRDVILAHFLGTGVVAEAFFVAQRIPNLLRDLAGEGAANAAIVPVLSEYAHQKSKQEWQELINVVMAWGVIILGAITIAGMIATPWIVRLIAPGFVGDAAKFQLTVDLTRIMFPYLILIGLTAFQMGILYSLHAFFAPAFGPCLLNVAMILSVWVACLFSWPLAYILAIGVLVGGVWQFWAQWVALKKRGVHWHKPQALNHEGAKQIGRLLIPRLWGSAVYQLNILVDTFCASLAVIVGAGGIAAIYYAARIIQFPLGVFGYALFSVSLPSLSKIASEGDMARFKATLVFSLRNLMRVLIPCATLMVIFSHWIIHLAFERGQFDAYST
ncbi:MAG: murein biosynthesis integral membrane protein MurJ, partial [Candidatus Omnitrophica bacterium]|nr:murein biosynthesis integral membrane protein MurJ [Candidatus Omnitrophota bacterium]